ncbi:MAG: hypothetical protein C5B60_02170 [Chloroflexi bacterium]|nr:MAG: hypothetical protein C5B60_02170 [Chloroflexota bacterium]
MDTATQTVSSNRLNTRALLRALAEGWLAYLPALRALPAGEVHVYLAEQGYELRQDLLAHITAWCEETLGVVPVLLKGGEVSSGRRDDGDQSYTAQAVARSRNFGSGEVERRFTQAHAALARMLAFLPEAALEDINVYGWLYTTIVEHFNAHRPPNLPALP